MQFIIQRGIALLQSGSLLSPKLCDRPILAGGILQSAAHKSTPTSDRERENNFEFHKRKVLWVATVTQHEQTECSVE